MQSKEVEVSMMDALDEKQLLLREISRMDQRYDPAVQLIKSPFSSPGYHTTLTAESYPFVHPTNANAVYVSALLDAGGIDRDERAFVVLKRLLELQDQNTASPTYGIWPWFYEEPLSQMSPPDWNWADFIGKQLTLCVLRHGDRLPQELAVAVRQAVRCAGESIIRRNMGPHYTNIAIMGTFVTLVAGEVYGWEDMKSYGLNRLEKIVGHVETLGTFQEFNSPAYSRIAVVELSRIRQAAQESRAKELAGLLLDRAWRMIAEHFHPTTREWAGPHSRSYGILMRDMERAFIQIGTGQVVQYFSIDNLPYDTEYYGNDIRCPDDYLAYFTDYSVRRRLVQRYHLDEATGREKRASTILTPHYAIGTFSEEIMWNQTRGMLAFFLNNGKAAYMRLRFLRDGYDFCSAVLKSSHSREDGAEADVEDVLLGIRFLTDGGDTHPNLDKTGGVIEAKDFRLRVEFGGYLGGESSGVDGDGKEATVQIGQTHVLMKTLYAAFEGGGTDLLPEGMPAWSISHEGDLLTCDLVLHSGSRKRIDLRTLENAVMMLHLRISTETSNTETNPDARVEVELGENVAAAMLHVQNRVIERLEVAVKPSGL
jgi:hypothetical protein